MGARAFQTLAALVLAGIWAIALGYAHLDGDIRFVDRIEATMTDLRTLVRGPRKPPEAVTIVAIDDDTVRQDGSYPLKRATLARIVESIARLDPKVIAVDLLLVDPGPDDGDRKLAEALAGRASVIAAAAVFAEGTQRVAADGDGPLTRLPNAERFLLPTKTFADVAAVGVVNVTTGQTGAPRLFPMLFRSGQTIEASLPLRVAAIAAKENPGIDENSLSLGDRVIRTDIGHVLPISFYGPRGTIPTISAAGVLEGRLDPARVKDHAVVIGATVTGGGDVFPTPFDPVLPGVEVISTAITHLMTGDGIVRDRTIRLADAGIGFVLATVLVGLLAWRSSAGGFAAIVAVILFWMGANVAAFAHGIWLSAALPMAAAAPPVLVFGAAQLWLGRRRAQYFATQSALLQRVQAPGLSEFLAQHPDFLSQPVREEAAVVFIDLSGFTGVSEILGPSAIRELLNTFHSLVDSEVVASGGVVISFMGDGAMIVFGLPEPKPEDTGNAARCCVRLAYQIRRWLASLPGETGSRIGFKIGAHFGTVVASRLGGGSRQHISATGDTVNVASRLMEVAASHNAEVAISDDLLKVAGSESELVASGELSGPMETQIRGRSGSLSVWLWRS
jgi:adenylate cyclase